MNKKLLSKEEQKARLKSELEKAKARLLNANDKLIAADSQLKIVRDELDDLENLKLKLETTASNNASVLSIITMLGILLTELPILILMAIFELKIAVLLYPFVCAVVDCSLILNWEKLVHKIFTKFEKIAIKKLENSKKYKNLLNEISLVKKKVEFTKDKKRRCTANYYMALDAERSLASKLNNPYVNDYGYKYKNYNAKSINCSEPKSLSSIKAKKRERKLQQK